MEFSFQAIPTMSRQSQRFRTRTFSKVSVKLNLVLVVVNDSFAVEKNLPNHLAWRWSETGLELESPGPVLNLGELF